MSIFFLCSLIYHMGYQPRAPATYCCCLYHTKVAANTNTHLKILSQSHLSRGRSSTSISTRLSLSLSSSSSSSSFLLMSADPPTSSPALQPSFLSALEVAGTSSGASLESESVSLSSESSLSSLLWMKIMNCY